jgi:hypothetical protein
LAACGHEAHESAGGRRRRRIRGHGQREHAAGDGHPLRVFGVEDGATEWRQATDRYLCWDVPHGPGCERGVRLPNHGGLVEDGIPDELGSTNPDELSRAYTNAYAANNF